MSLNRHVQMFNGFEKSSQNVHKAGKPLVKALDCRKTCNKPAQTRQQGPGRVYRRQLGARPVSWVIPGGDKRLGHVAPLKTIAMLSGYVLWRRLAIGLKYRCT
jgi:hypothetical protein